MSTVIEIRLPKAARLFYVGFSSLWCSFGLFIAVVLAASGSPLALIPVAMVILGGGIGFRLVHLRALTQADELLVRNYFRTYRLARERIKDFSIDRYGGVSVAPHSVSIGWTFVIEARLSDDKLIPLEVTRWPRLAPRTSTTLERQLAGLRSWSQPDQASKEQLAIIEVS